MNSEERRMCLLSNYGRWLGWEVWLDEQCVCSLNFESSQDAEWDCYVISNVVDGYEATTDTFLGQCIVVYTFLGSFPRISPFGTALFGGIRNVRSYELVGYTFLLSNGQFGTGCTFCFNRTSEEKCVAALK